MINPHLHLLVRNQHNHRRHRSAAQESATADGISTFESRLSVCIHMMLRADVILIFSHRTMSSRSAPSKWQANRRCDDTNTGHLTIAIHTVHMS